MLRSLLLLMLLILSTSNSWSQNNENMFQDYKKLPVPPSPNAAALGKFGEIPVNMSTGIPSISIPFFSYSDPLKKLALNISLNYHAGGHKVEDMASNTGLGWALSAGGMISRTMRGKPDDDINGYLNTPALPYFNTINFNVTSSFPGPGLSISEGVGLDNSPTHYQTIKQIAEGGGDGESDLFNISVGSLNGKFFFTKGGEIKFVTQSNLKISCNYFGSGRQIIKEFIVTDPQGVKYFFSERESTEITNPAGSDPVNAVTAYTSSWHISKIVSTDDKHEILFNYNIGSTTNIESGFSESYQTLYSQNNFIVEYKPLTQSRNTITSATKRISSIIFPDATQLLFSYNFSRLDLNGDLALTEIKLKNASLEKKWDLSYGYFESDFCEGYANGCTPGIPFSSNDYYKRLKLISVQEKAGTKHLPPYTFEYNSNKLPVRNSKLQDWWGFYNGIGGDGVAAVFPAGVWGYSSPLRFANDQPANLQHTLSWVLDKIYYPTGGNTKFYFELNEGYYGSNLRKVGGLRVSKLIDFEPSTGVSLVTKYSYTKENNFSSGIIKVAPTRNAFWSVFYNNPSEGQQGDDPIIPHAIHEFNETLNPSQTLTYAHGSPIMYERVKVNKESNSQTLGYSVYEYSTDAGTKAHDEVYPFIQRQESEWYNLLLLKEKHYNSLSELVKSKENQYTILSPFLSDTSSYTRNLVTSILYRSAQSTPALYIWGARAYQMEVGRSELKKTIERDYSDGVNFVENVTEYEYDNQYYVPIKITQKNSKNELNEQRLYYAFNFNTTGLSTKTDFIAANRVAEPITQELWQKKGTDYFIKNIALNNYTVINSMLKNNKLFQLERSGTIPFSVIGNFNPSQALRNAGIKEQVHYTSFDSKGRHTDMTLTGGMNHTFFWGISNQMPLCQVTNCISSNMAYTSFETDGAKNWQGINTNSIVSSKSVMGLAFYQQNNFSVYTAGLNSTTKYIVAYWSKNGSYSVTGTQSGWPKQGKNALVNGQTWTYYEHLILGNSTVFVNSSGIGAIDELRLYPELAQMTTLAFNPLTGLTEQADTKDNITYYKYDEFFRLNRIVDFQGNILKSICYNFYNQIEDCVQNPTQTRWVATAEVRCKACSSNLSFSSMEQERREVDMNAASATYNLERWVNTGMSSNCEQIGVWVNSTYCQQENGQNTGNLVTTQTDVNPCSPTYNTTRTVSILSNQSSCPPPGCSECVSGGLDKKCINGNCESGFKVYTASTYNPSTGMYDCTFHYEWSDGTWSPNYIESTPFECPVS